MAEPQRIVIVGAGVGGATAAATLRERGYAGEVVLLAAEDHPPYELPALSKGLLLGDTDEPDWVREADFYRANDIELRRDTAATRVELGARLVVDSKGGEHAFDRLLLATGSQPRSLPLPGADLPGVRTLRTLDDALALRGAFSTVERIVIIGAGWIGTEAAAAARKHGLDVTVVDRIAAPLRPVLGAEVAKVFQDLHAEHGVQWRLNADIARLTGTGSVDGLRLTDGTELPADLVLVAVGVKPRVELAHTAGLELADDGGVAVDATLRTSAPDVFAVGDIASHFHPHHGKRLRVEHWANAKNQGAHVAANLVGGEEPYTRAPYFFSDQYDLGCEYRGVADPDTDRLVVRGDLRERQFIAFWLREGRVVAAMNVNDWDNGDALGRIVGERLTVPEEVLVKGDLSSVE
ncbi:NADPH-dependent 2,4-dienoyl-CoA reductase/sulfur reductase-like enzyme [Amycolatopsis bartoniae]|uniref:Ferredoxin reductase n=1 Tax=Amycolatopsis bartoniae TaxID=941986 RepID=A0A8H9J7J7_9PSEU|nr:FAD/NAD(P)-binding oxidoreductase [Amycolatopsis bartoniae]MBB2934201.1 NADPH-dependent 2,4-dienoyl-CoA reductase/sulfur reductase-like enzyme [Amycolatopsis bartoniae]TVT08686.1 NAD(P)/FAD-dependent oxidoreductase [Amycolatopsis bartoniae]GHF88487.1 ferredoxin reductase [Amycolatopsis bartoniae]